MDDFYYKLVCVDEQDPLEYKVLEDVNLENLEAVHKYVLEHIDNHTPEIIKWMLMPMKKQKVKIRHFNKKEKHVLQLLFYRNWRKYHDNRIR